MFSSRHRTITIFILCGILSAILAIFFHSSGPRLSEVTYDNPDYITEISLRTNARLDETITPNIEISPAVDNNATVSGQRIIIRLDQPLASDTTYRLTTSNVTDTRGKASELVHEFHTKRAVFSYLERNLGEPDRIFRRTVGVESEVIYEADTVFAFVDGKDSLLVIEGRDSQPVLRDISSGETITPDPNSTPERIYGGKQGDVYLVTFNTKNEDNSSNLRSYAYDATTGDLSALRNLNGDFIRVGDAQIGPDGESFIYQELNDFSIYIDNFFDEKDAILLGTASRVVRYMPNNSGVAIERPDRQPGSMEFIESFSGDRTDIDLGPAASRSFVSVNQTAYFIENQFETSDVKRSVQMKTPSDQPSTLIALNNQLSYSSLATSRTDDLISLEFANIRPVYDVETYGIHAKPIDNEISIYSTDGTYIESVIGSSLQWH